MKYFNDLADFDAADIKGLVAFATDLDRIPMAVLHRMLSGR